MSAHGDRQHASTEDQGQLPMAVPAIRDAHPLLVDEPEQGLDSFDSEISLGIADRHARVELTSDLDFFPSEQSEQVEAHDRVVSDQPPVVVGDEVVAVDRPAPVAQTESLVAAPPEDAAPVAAIPPPPSVPLTRRLALVAGIFACLGLPALGVLLWRSPTPLVAPPAVRDAVFPAARTVPPEPIPTLLATPRSGGLATFKPTPPRAPVGAIEPAADTRGPSETPVPRVPEMVAVAPGTAAPVRPERPTRSPAVASEPTVAPPSVAAAATSISNAPSEANVRPSPTATPVTPNPTPPPSMNVPAAPSLPAPSMVTPAMPASAGPVPDAGEPNATTTALARDAADIEAVLTRYRSAFGELDPAAVSQVWPNADSRALARAFRGLEQQGIAFDNCDITVAGTSAAASCAGTVRYVTKVGSKDPRTERRRWQFTFGKVRDRWTIQTVESR